MQDLSLRRSKDSSLTKVSVKRVDGGRFFRGDCMQVKRIDLFDYQITLTEQEFNLVKLKAESEEQPIELALEVLFELAFECLADSPEGKET